MLRLVLLFAALLFPTFVIAAQPEPLSTDVYGRLPNIELMQLSPSGERLAFIVVSGDRRQLVVKDVTDHPILAIPVADTKVRYIAWADENHLVIITTEANNFGGGNDEYAHSLIVNLATQKAFVVFSTNPAVFHSTYGYFGAATIKGHLYGFFGGVTMQKTRGFDATFNFSGSVELYRVDLDTEQSEITAPGAQRPHNWAIDANGSVVARSEYDQNSGRWTLWSGKEGGHIIAVLPDPLGEIDLKGLGRAPGKVLVDKAIPEEWSLSDGAHEPIITDRMIDASGYLFDSTTQRLVGVYLVGDRADQQFFDPVLMARQAALRRALGGAPLLVSWSADFRRLIAYTEGGHDPGTYWLVDGRSVRAYAYAYPELPDANVGVSQMIEYKAGDGLTLHGVLTLPPGRDPKNLPLVVLPHGGLEAHDRVGFDWWAQAFASRGYAVFQPNFRGSDGYGIKLRDAGFGQWGRKMQTDLSDGVAELAREGIIDPKRACIVGASYGGYAALAGVTVQHGLYRCAVSYGGISDLNYFMNSESPPNEEVGDTATARYLRKFLGAKSNDDSALHEISPARLAADADAPILLIHGADDSVVPIGQSREMERNLRRAGKPVEFVVIKNEDHWLSRDASRKAVLNASITFVEKNNPAN